MSKFQLIDIEDERTNDAEDNPPVTKEEALVQIQEWNDEMGTFYESIKEFNESEQYWQWVPVNPVSH
jgi:hypothetical protein